MRKLAGLCSSRRSLGQFGLVLLVIAGFAFDFAHGIMLGEQQIAFHPVYRLRQSLAVAISRLHTPAPGGYLAYGSVLKVLNENGFAIFPNEGPPFNLVTLDTLMRNAPELSRIFQRAATVAIDPALPPDIIRANELGYADYTYFAFRLFGLHVSSWYYFYFLLLGISAAVFFLEFRQSPFCLFLLALFVAEIYFLETYASRMGMQLASVANNRLFSALSLLAAIHLLLLVWWRRPPRLASIVGAGVQGAVLVFLMFCRTEIVWQVAMVLVAAALIALCALWRGRREPTPTRRRVAVAARQAWPAAILLAALSCVWLVTSFAVDDRYTTEPKGHIIWHEILIGLLSSSPELRREYLGTIDEDKYDQDKYTDTMVYDAVIRDLNARNDTSSPISFINQGHITIDLMQGWGLYDRMVRSLTLRIILKHPLLVIEGLAGRPADQLHYYTTHKVMAPRFLVVPALLAALAVAANAAAGGFRVGGADLRQGGLLLAFILAFATITPIIEPSNLAVGSLFCYLGAIVIVPCFAMAALGRLVGWGASEPA